MTDESTRAMTHEDEEMNGADDRQLAPHNIVDLRLLGRRIRALRILHGYDRVSDFTSVLRGQYGVEVTDRTVYAIERGEQMPHLDFMYAVTAALEPEPDYFTPAIRNDVAMKLRHRDGR